MVTTARVAVLVIDPSQDPLFMAAPHRPRHIDKLYSSRISVYTQALVEINIPNKDLLVKHNQLWSSIHAPDRSALTEDSLHTQLMAGDGVIRKDDYMQDIEGLQLWSEANEPTVDHFLNAQLISRHPNSLFSLLEDNHEGITLPSYYLKTNVSYYRMHYERGYFPFSTTASGGAVCGTSYWRIRG